jgi:hypothetical protein
MLHQPIITDVSGIRRFACSAVALVNFIVNEEEKEKTRRWMGDD